MSKSKIGTWEAIMIVLTIVVSHSILSLPVEILNLSKSASLLNLIYVSIIAIFIGLLIYKLLSKFPGLDIIDISETLGGKLLKNIVGIIFITYFIFSYSLMLRSFCESLKIIYFSMTDITFIILLFVIAVCVANRLDFNATLKTNLLIIPLFVGSIIFLFIANLSHFEPQKIFPILGDGLFTTFVLGFTNLASFSGIVFLYFLPPFLKEPEKFKNVVISSIIITAIYLIVCVAILLFMFSFFIDNSEIAPLYNATRYIEIGNFFQRLDSIFLFFWILIFACYLSIVTKFSMHIFKKLTNIDDKKALIDIFGFLVLGIALLPKNYSIVEKFETEIFPYLALIIVFFFGISILICANLHQRNKL